MCPNVWLHSSVGRASHRYRGGHGFESHWSPDFFRLLLSNCLNWKFTARSFFTHTWIFFGKSYSCFSLLTLKGKKRGEGIREGRGKWSEEGRGERIREGRGEWRREWSEEGRGEGIREGSGERRRGEETREGRGRSRETEEGMTESYQFNWSLYSPWPVVGKCGDPGKVWLKYENYNWNALSF